MRVRDCMATSYDLSFPTIAVILILLVVFAGIIPAYVSHIRGEDSFTSEMQKNEETNVVGSLQSIVTEIRENPNDADITLFDSNTGELVKTGTLEEGDSTELEFENGNVTITVVEVTSLSSVIVMYEYPVSYQWDSLISGLLMAIAAILVILFLYLLLLLLSVGDS